MDDPDSGATKVSIDLDNTLVAVAQSGTSSVIAKKDFGAAVTRANVPGEPGGVLELPEPSAAVSVLGLAVLAMRRGRRAV